MNERIPWDGEMGRIEATRDVTCNYTRYWAPKYDASVVISDELMEAVGGEVQNYIASAMAKKVDELFGMVNDDGEYSEWDDHGIHKTSW